MAQKTLKALRRNMQYDLLQANGYQVQSNRLKTHDIDMALQLAINELATLTGSTVQKTFRRIRQKALWLKARATTPEEMAESFVMPPGTLFVSETEDSADIEAERANLEYYESRKAKPENP